MRGRLSQLLLIFTVAILLIEPPGWEWLVIAVQCVLFCVIASVMGRLLWLLFIITLVLMFMEPPHWFLWVWLPIGVQCVLICVTMWKKRLERAQEERFERGLCLQCGYDLRGRNLRCPECGYAVDPRLA